MVLARCDMCDKPKGRKGNMYVVAAEPLGYPNTSTVCGTSGCENPALIWLTDEENNAYHRGQRVFRFATSTSKVKVQSLYGGERE
jgi:hypothetical protein